MPRGVGRVENETKRALISAAQVTTASATASLPPKRGNADMAAPAELFFLLCVTAPAMTKTTRKITRASHRCLGLGTLLEFEYFAAVKLSSITISAAEPYLCVM